MKTTRKLLLCVGLICALTRLPADPVTFNFEGALPYNYSFGLEAFSNTTFSGSFTYDNSAILPAQWNSSVTGVDNVSFHLQFSNGYHVDFTQSLLDYSPWSGATDLLASGGPFFVIGGQLFGTFSPTASAILNGANNPTGHMLSNIYFMIPAGGGDNLVNGFHVTGAYGQMNIGNSGISATNVNISPVPDTGVTIGLLAAALMGLGLMRRRFLRA